MATLGMQMTLKSSPDNSISVSNSNSSGRHGSNYVSRSADEHLFDGGKNSSSTSSDALKLLSALEDFIRPFATTISKQYEEESSKHRFSPLSPDAQALVDAFAQFIKGTLNIQKVNAEHVAVPTSSVMQVRQPVLPPKLGDALRTHVFNSVPIRLIHFGAEGSGMRLIERNDIFEHISQKMLRDVDEASFHTSVDKEYASRNLQGQPLYQTLEEAEQAVITTLIERHSRYAILSHTWIQDGSGEVTYSDWQYRKGDTAFQKIARFCKVAAQNHNVTLAWMDTICINKDSSSELDESIRSMYKWYNNSYLCITYLADTKMIADMRGDRWFTRGWTLQELLAPRQIKFYDKDWSPLTSRENDKHSRNIKTEIKIITTITSSELSRFHRNVHDVEISRKMQWAASRQVTKEEDAAYSLLGIFGVSIPIAYGEGAQRAFFRLVEAILASSQEVWDVFNCAARPPGTTRIHHSSLIPSSPKDYLRRSASFDGTRGHSPIASATLLEPIILTHLGVRMRVLFLLAQEATAGERYIPYRRFSGTATISVLKDFAYIEQAFNLFSQTAFYGRIPESREIPAFCVLNFSETTDAVYIPSDCLALGFQWSFDDSNRLTSTGNRRRMITKEPIVLKLHDSCTDQQFTISKKDLATEGLQLFTLHL